MKRSGLRPEKLSCEGCGTPTPAAELYLTSFGTRDNGRPLLMFVCDWCRTNTRVRPSYAEAGDVL